MTEPGGKPSAPASSGDSPTGSSAISPSHISPRWWMLRPWLRRLHAWQLRRVDGGLRMRLSLRLSETHTMLLWAAAVGALGALATVVFRDAISAVQIFLTGRDGSLVDLAQGLPWQWRLLMPAGGGVVAGFFLVWSRRMPAAANSDYMEAVAIGDGRVPVRQSLLRSVSSLATIASGGSIGREGSMVQLAALCASLAGRVLHFPVARLRLLVACGAAAGITSAYSAPIAGAFFVSEIVLGAMAMESFGPIVVAAVVANITMRALPGYRPAYEMPSFPDIGSGEMVLFVFLGVGAGLLAPQFLRLLGASKKQFARTAWPMPLRLGIGGLAVGAMSIWVPQVWGNGYSVVNSLLHTEWVWWSVLLILACKVTATALTTGSGAIGGIFTPTLFVGASVGLMFGQLVHGWWPQGTSAPFAYAMVGMGAFLAAATSAPLMAILMIFEMTLSHQVMLPLMLACVVAYFVARSVGGVSMYDITLKRSREEEARIRLRGTHMRDLIKPAMTVLRDDAPFAEVTAMFLHYPVKYVYLVDARQHYLGVVALQDVTSLLLEQGAVETRTAGQFLRGRFLHEITPDMSLGQALQLFLDHNGERLPAIQSIEEPVLLGVVDKTSLLDAYFRLDRARSDLSAEQAR